MKFVRNVFILALLPLMLASCQSFKGSNCVQRIAAVQSSIASAANTSSRLVAEGEMSSSTGVDVHATLSSARDASKRAMNICRAGSSEWQEWAIQAQGLVNDVQSEIKELEQ